MRDLFHVPDSYFLSHSVGCLPKSASKSLDRQFLQPWQTGRNWADWMPILDEFRQGIAHLLSVDSSGICPQINVSSALTKIIYSLPQDETKKTILLSKQDFPTIGFVMQQAERMGLTIRFIDGPINELSAWSDALDSSVAIVHITHALSNTSRLLPVKDICDLAKSHDAITILDAAQSLGVVPVNPVEWGVDFVIGTGVKFLCAGPGACFLYAAPDILPLCTPVDVGWFSHENPFEMDISNFRYADDAMRFFGGTPSPAPLALANSAMDIWKSLNQETVHKIIDKHLSFLCSHVDQDIIISPTHSGQRGATFVIAPKDKAALRQILSANHISHDERKDGFRFSVHGYTERSELETLVNVINSAD